MSAPLARSVLVLAYYFPPMGLSGVQRTAKFVKYLPENDWQVTVLTVQPGGYFAFDQGLLDELDRPGIRIVRTTSWDPTRVFGTRRQVGLPSETRRRALSGLSQTLFIPDNKVGWIPAALREGDRLLRNGTFDVIYSSAPPYSSHIAAARLARKHKLPLVLDYRDDWLDNPRHVYATPAHRPIHRWMETYALRTAASVLTINPVIARALSERGAPSVQVLPQGFDPQDYPPDPSRPAGAAGLSRRRLQVIYSGVFYDRQTPLPFLEALARLNERVPDLSARLEAVFVGLFPKSASEAVQTLGLSQCVRVEPYTSHEEAMRMVVEADVAWLMVGEGPGQDQISTGKLYAYAGAHKPILGLVPHGAARNELESYGASWIAHPDRPAEVDAALTAILECWNSGELPVPDAKDTERFDRRYLTRKLAEALEQAATAIP